MLQPSSEGETGASPLGRKAGDAGCSHGCGLELGRAGPDGWRPDTASMRRFGARGPFARWDEAEEAAAKVTHRCSSIRQAAGGEAFQAVLAAVRIDARGAALVFTRSGRDWRCDGACGRPWRARLGVRAPGA